MPECCKCCDSANKISFLERERYLLTRLLAEEREEYRKYRQRIIDSKLQKQKLNRIMGISKDGTCYSIKVNKVHYTHEGLFVEVDLP